MKNNDHKEQQQQPNETTSKITTDLLNFCLIKFVSNYYFNILI